MPVQHCILSTEEEALELAAVAKAAGLTKTDYLLSKSTKSGAWRANRVRSSGRITTRDLAAQDGARTNHALESKP